MFHFIRLQTLKILAPFPPMKRALNKYFAVWRTEGSALPSMADQEKQRKWKLFG